MDTANEAETSRIGPDVGCMESLSSGTSKGKILGCADSSSGNPRRYLIQCPMRAQRMSVMNETGRSLSEDGTNE